MLKNILQKLISVTSEYDYPYRAFGIFGAITYPAYYISWVLVNPTGYENLTMRIVVVLLCIPLILENHWPDSLRKYLRLYWYLVICYSLPFLFAFLLLMNHFSFDSILNTYTVVVLSILLLEIIPLIFVLVIGISLGILAFLMISGPTDFHTNYLTISLTFASLILFGSIFTHKKSALQKERLSGMTMASETIAHELRTPLAAIKFNNEGLKDYLPDLIQSYQLAKEASLPVGVISKSQLQSLQNVINRIDTEISSANLFIDMLMLKLGNINISSEDLKACSMVACLSEAINRYPFHSQEENILSYRDAKDFIFLGDELLTIHIISNLIQNALYAIAEAGKGEISISTESNEKYNILIFKDTGSGIPANSLPKIFDRFYTKKRHGSGIGLNYCKLIMGIYGGEITVKSKEGSYTEFKLRFPNKEIT